MGEIIWTIIAGTIVHIVMWIFGTVIWNILKGIGTSVRLCFFLGKKPIEEVWDHPDNALVGFLTLVIGSIAFFIIAASINS